jgi:hypothetical protein
MSTDDTYLLAAADASMLQDRILVAAEIPDHTDGGVAARALGNALVAVVQEYLERVSNEHDVELFCEVNGAQPEDVASWPVNILAGLRLRRTPPDDRHSICQSAVETAVRYVRASSSLAWGRRP